MYKLKIFRVIAEFVDSIKGSKVNHSRKKRTASDAKNRLRKDIESHRIKNNQNM